MFRTIFLSTLLLVGLTLFAARVIYPLVTGQTIITIEGNSMQPSIEFGSLAYIEQAPQYKIGDIITYRSGQGLITHRITADISGTGQLWEVRGDNVDLPDPQYITNDQILGRITFVIPLLGTIGTVLAQPVVIAFVLFLALATLLWPSTKPQQPEDIRHAHST